MSAEGWIFVVGFRIFDVGLLVFWLVWLFRARNDGADPSDEGGDDPGGGPPLTPDRPVGGGGLGLLTPGTLRQGRRLREDAPRPSSPRRRGGEPLLPRPARVR
ncbi:MAG TPA: hypothetical protein VD790_06535 [Thermoleophilaceae bacterium]|nr:hypothetical protein [Thermoleophilaceae bacterium]